VKILITGKSGQVGWELQRILTPLGNIVATDRSELDLTSAMSIRDRVREIDPNIIVNAGAYTSVDKAESEPELAMAVNGIAPGILAEEAERLDALLIHYSTDYVFDGTKNEPYVEGDIPNPLNIYGETKLAGERAVQAAGAAHIILRTSWIYGSRGQNFMLTMLRLAKEREELRVVNDQIGAPTWCHWTAEATREIIKMQVRANFKNLRPTSEGIVHLTASGSTSWFGFASEIIAGSREARGRQPKVVPVSSAQYPTAAKRPRNSLLSDEKLRRVFGIEPEPWQTGLQSALAEWVGQ
jgi:dTDP-4-dehydrorhamnose reductase